MLHCHACSISAMCGRKLDRRPHLCGQWRLALMTAEEARRPAAVVAGAGPRTAGGAARAADVGLLLLPHSLPPNLYSPTVPASGAARRGSGCAAPRPSPAPGAAPIPRPQESWRPAPGTPAPRHARGPAPLSARALLAACSAPVRVPVRTPEQVSGTCARVCVRAPNCPRAPRRVRGWAGLGRGWGG
jgi:hypothetical protein